MRNNRRQSLKVTSSLQYRFLAITLIYSFVIVCFFSVGFFGPDVIKLTDKNLSLESRGFAANDLLMKHSWFWPGIALLIIALGLHSFREFQRIAGPLYRFRWAFDQLEMGNLTFTVKLRKKDLLDTEEMAINNMIRTLVGRLGTIKQATDEAVQSVDELEQSLNKGSEWTETQIDLLRAHREHLGRLSTAVQYFRLDDGEQKTDGSGSDT